MKKIFGTLLTAVLLLTFMAIPAMAAEATFKDTLEDNYPKIYKKSDKIVYQYNTDLETSFYLKVDTIKTEEYIIYKLDGDITGFSIDTFHTNGLGTPDDVSVYVSKDENSWVKVETKALDLYFNEDIYINYDLAYWLQSTVSNKNPIGSGYRYLKICLNPYTVDGSVPWNTALDTVNITYKSSGTTTNNTTKNTTTTSSQKNSPTSSSGQTSGTDVTTTLTDTTESTGETESTNLIETTNPATTNDSETNTGSDNSNSLIWVWIIVALVIIGGGVGAFLYLRNRKMNDNKI